MKLFYSPGACSLASHIVACEAGIPLHLERVDLGTKKTASGGDFLAINPKGYVPALKLDNGELLTEGPAIMQYLADQKPATALAPPNGSFQRYRLQEWLGFINSEVHKPFGALFGPGPQAAREERIDMIKRRLALVDGSLAGKSFLMGEEFTVADAYLLVMLAWADYQRIDLSSFAALTAFQKRVGKRPAVQKALQEEGLA